MLLALVAGALATAALPPLYIFPALFIAFPALILLLDSCSTARGAFAIGWAFGVGHLSTGLFWVANALAIAGAPPAAAIPLPLGVALFPGVAGLLYWLVSRRLDAPVLVFTSAWMVAEWARGHIPFGGFPWNLAGYSWAFSDAMSQFAALGGAYGLTLLTVFAACCPVHLVGRAPRSLAFWRPLLVMAGALAALLVYGLIRLPTDLALPDGPRVRIVQANIPQELKWRADLRGEHFVRYLSMSHQDADDHVDLLLWPEAAIPYRLDQEPARTVLIGQLMRPGGFVLAGFPRAERVGDRYAFFNSMIVIDHVGRDHGLFDKFHLVPFGEYIPLAGAFAVANTVLGWFGFENGVEKLVAGAGDFTPGPGPQVMQLGDLPSVSPLICYEVIFPGQVTPRDERPGWLYNLTNDSWYGDLSGPYQHMTIARFRSIEEGLPMVRAAQTGISAIIDPYGRVLRKLDLGKRGVIDGVLPPALPPTLFGRYGNWIFLLMLGACIFVAIAIGVWRAKLGPVAK